MNTIKILRPRFLGPLCEVFGLPRGSFCILSRMSFDGKREVWAMALDYQGRCFPRIVLGDNSGASVSWIKAAIKPAVEMAQKAFTLPEYAKFSTHKEEALLCGAIELGYVGGLRLHTQETSNM